MTMKPVLFAATLLVSFAAFADSPFTPNSVKYADTSIPPATGRTGDATIEARALLARDTTTELIVASNGSIEKVQVKIGDLTTNYQASGSQFVTKLTGLRRRQTFAVQANVASDDVARTGIVDADVTVKRAPELNMQFVTAPPHALAGVPVHIAADVEEMLGDSGARTNCVLLNDGAEIDRAADIWINANGRVACEFATIFPPGSGTVNLQVVLRDTFPSDWSTSSDDSAPFSIKVYDRLTAMEMWNAGGIDVESYYEHYYQSQFGENASLTDGQTTDTFFNAVFRTTQPNVETLRASLKVTTDARIIFDNHDITFDYQAVDWGWYKQQCAISLIDERDSFVRSCRIQSFMDGLVTTFNYSLRSGDVTYVSSGWYSLYIGGPPFAVWYSNHRDVYGNGYRLGDTLDFALALSDGTNYWALHPSMNVTTTSGEWNMPYTCFNEGTPWYACSWVKSHYIRKDAWAAGGGQ